MIDRDIIKIRHDLKRISQVLKMQRENAQEDMERYLASNKRMQELMTLLIDEFDKLSNDIEK